MRIIYLLVTLFCLTNSASLHCESQVKHHIASSDHLYDQYQKHHQTPSDINEHLPLLRELARECSSVVEIGIRGIVSTWGVLQGLAENSHPNPTYLGIDLELPPEGKLDLAQVLAEQHGIEFTFWQANDLEIEIPETELLFIDSMHTYCHLTYELETFAPYVRKYIALHDTSFPWGHRNDICYEGDYSEYPAHYDRTKAGLWPAVIDFLKNHPEWMLKARHKNNHGFTILERKVHQ